MSSRGQRPVQRTETRSTNDIIIRASVTASIVAVAAILALVAASKAGDIADADAMAHIHGLAVDPADGQLVAATHYGAFEVDRDGDLSRVGPVQDLMGFAIVGARHYLASGHPGADQKGQPNNLGLIESTDGGKSWRTLSLRGKADFHKLEARHDRVYAHYKGRLMVSEDKQTWDERAELYLEDIAVSPTDPETIVMATDSGIKISSDGGRTTRALPNTPTLSLVEWSSDGVIVGITDAGRLHTSNNQGVTWTARGSAGSQPVALAAEADAVFVATRGGAVLQSDDGGDRFDVRYSGA